MHSVGFHHEHSRPDRDKYITINWKNIDKDKKNNFLKKKLDQVNLIGEYDICSVVHYDINVFVKEDLLKVRSIFQFIAYAPVQYFLLTQEGGIYSWAPKWDNR